MLRPQGIGISGASRLNDEVALPAHTILISSWRWRSVAAARSSARKAFNEVLWRSSTTGARRDPFVVVWIATSCSCFARASAEPLIFYQVRRMAPTKGISGTLPFHRFRRLGKKPKRARI